MASNDALILLPRSAALERSRETIVMVRWALILTCAYLLIVCQHTVGPSWLGPLLVAGFLASNLLLGRTDREHFGRQSFKVALGIMDTMLIVASLFVAQELSAELLLLCLGVLVMAIAGLRIGVIASVTLAITIGTLALHWVIGSQIIWQSSMLLRVPFLLGAALVFALLVEGQGGRHAGAALGEPSGDLFDVLATRIGQQNEAIRRCRDALVANSTASAREALEDVMLHNRQMAQSLSRAQSAEARAA